MNNSIPILIADDDQDNRDIFKEVFEILRLNNPVFYLRNGEEVFDFLENNYPFEDPIQFPMPGLIFLDRHMPILDGSTTLKKVRKDKRFSHIPIVMVTASISKEHIRQSYQWGANSLISKPLDFDSMVSIFETTMVYWLETVNLP